jgi:hypothetical protein
MLDNGARNILHRSALEVLVEPRQDCFVFGFGSFTCFVKPALASL